MRKLWLVGAIVLVMLLAALFIHRRKKPVDTASASPTAAAAPVTRKRIDPLAGDFSADQPLQ